MFWVDEICEDILKKYPEKDHFLIRDEKTPSGRVHVGSIRGVVIHGVIAQALREKRQKVKFIYEINDADPMDGLPIYLDPEKYKEQMGKPLKDVPSPETGYENYARFFAKEFIDVIHFMGFEPEIIFSSDLYKQGLYNEWIDFVLRHPDDIRKIYKEVSGSEKPETWNPLHVICEHCGKVGTTHVKTWDGKEVEYVCEPEMVRWAKGCGYHGKVVPYNGRGKFPWKVEWPVKWAALQVDIEGSGKDHNAAGGSHEISEMICRNILKKPVPYNIPYEFFLISGAKMSSSKGLGIASKEISEMMPPEMLRFLMIRTHFNQTIDFKPEGETIPRLFDRYDEVATEYFEGTTGNPDWKRIFYYSQLDPNHIVNRYRPRFSRIAFMLQIPHLDIEEEVAKLKGSPLTAEDKRELEMRIEYAKLWLEKYATEKEKFIIQEATPEKARSLTLDQKQFLLNIVKLLEEKERQGEELHAAIHELRKQSPLQPKEAFQAIYLALLGKDSGPQAGWFLEALEKDFVIQRFREVS